MISSYPQLGRFGGTGTSINFHSGEYYLFYGLGEEGYIGTISKFSIAEEVKESDLVKKKKEKLQHLLMHSSDQLSSDSSRDLNF